MNMLARDAGRGFNLQQALPPEPVGIDAFLGWADGQEGRFELVEGRIRMMTGATLNHNRVWFAFAQALARLLDATRFEVQAEFGVRTASGLRYPDVLVLPRQADGRARTATDPIVLAEVLSPTSVSIDMIEKPGEYGAIPSVMAYVVLSQDEPAVWLWQRRENSWPARPEPLYGPEAILSFPSLGVSLALADVYRAIGS